MSDNALSFRIIIIAACVMLVVVAAREWQPFQATSRLCTFEEKRALGMVVDSEMKCSQDGYCRVITNKMKAPLVYLPVVGIRVYPQWDNPDNEIAVTECRVQN